MNDNLTYRITRLTIYRMKKDSELVNFDKFAVFIF